MAGSIAEALKLKTAVPLPPTRPTEPPQIRQVDEFETPTPAPTPAPVGGNLARAAELRQAQDSRTVLGEIGAMGPAIARGGGNVIAGAGEGLGLRTAQRYGQLLRDFDAIDAGEIPPTRLQITREPAALADYSLIQGQIGEYEQADPAGRMALRSKYLPQTDPRNVEAFQWGNELRKTLTGAFPEDPAYKGRFSQLLGEGIGSLGAFALTGVGTMGAGALPLGMLSGSAEGFRDAIVHGATLDQAFDTADINTLIGATEFLPLVRMLRIGDRATGGMIRQALARGIEGATEEAVQESFAEVMRNLVAANVIAYDPERGIFQGTQESAQVGGSTGGLYGVLSGLILGGRRRGHGEIRKELEDVIEGRAEPTPAPVAVPPEATVAPEAVTAAPVEPTQPPVTAAPVTPAPTPAPTTAPVTAAPTLPPVLEPIPGATAAPEPATEDVPTSQPATAAPTAAPTAPPVTAAPTVAPEPTAPPVTAAPTPAPTVAPTVAPTAPPATAAPTQAPTAAPATKPEQTAPVEGTTREPTARPVEARASYDTALEAWRTADPEGYARWDANREAPIPATTPEGQAASAAQTAFRRSIARPRREPSGAPDPGPIQEARAATQPGPSHRGRRPESAFDPARPMGKVPADRNQIVARLARDLDVPLYQGRVGQIASPATQGFYRQQTGELRLKRGSDLETMAHEAAHVIDQRFPEIAQTFKADPGIVQELRDVSYDRTDVGEGFAEFIRLWATQPEEAQALAPKASAAWRDFLAKRPAVHKPFQRFREDALNWFDADPEARMVSKIGGKTARADPVVNVLFGVPGRLRQAVLDDFHGFFSASRKLDKNGAVDESRTTVYESMRLTRGAQSMIAASYRFGAPVWRDNQTGIDFQGPGLREIFAPIRKDQDKFYRYLVARRARSLREQGRENLISPEEIKAGLALETPAFKKAALGYQEWNRKLLAFAVTAGVIDADSAKRMAQYFYVPFYRVGEAVGSGAGRKPGDWKGLRALRGGTANLRPIGDNIRANAAMLIKASIDNWARQQAAEAATRKGGAAIMAPVPAGSRPVMIDRNQIAATVRKSIERENITLDDQGQAIIDQALDAIAPMSQLWQLNQPAPGRNVVAVMWNGKPKWYEVPDPVVYRGFLAMDRPRPLAPGILRWFRRIGQTGVVLSDSFILGNLQRDAVMSAAVSRGHLIPVIDGLRGIKHRMVEDKVYRSYIANLGGMSSIYTDEEATAAEAWLRTNGIEASRVINFPSVALGFMEKLLEAVEMGPKISEFRKAEARGATGFKAAFEGRDIVDYAMKGDNAAAVFLYDTVIFLKAALVSWDKLGRAVLTDPQRARTAFKIAMVMGLSGALHMLNKDNPDYEDLEDWKKDVAWHFWVNGEHYMLLKVWDLGFLSNVVEHTIDKLEGKEGRDIWQTIARAYGVNFWPHALEPIFEQMMNRERFFDRAIVPPWIEKRQTWAEYTPWTSPTIRKLGEWTRGGDIEISPARAEAAVRGYLGTLGAYGLMLADRIVAPDEGLSATWFAFPATSRWKQQGIARSKAVDDLYELRNAAEEAWVTGQAIRNFEGLEDDARFKRGLDRWSSAMSQMNKFAYRALEEKDVSALRNMAGQVGSAEKVASAGDSPRQLRRVIVDALTERKNTFSRGLLKQLKALKASDDINSGEAAQR